jgi:hypothetical protein
MKKSERILLIGTVVMVSLYVLDRMGGINSMLNLLSMNTLQVSALKEKNNNYRNDFLDIKNVQKEFYDIERIFQTEGDAQKDARFLFTEQLSAIVAEIDKKTPDISPAESEPIPDVSEYQYLVVTMRVRKIEEEQMRELLARIYDENIIVQKLTVTGQPDSTIVNCDLTLAKIKRADATPATTP